MSCVKAWHFVSSPDARYHHKVNVDLPSFLNDGPISNTLSIPPNISRFSHNSGAILNVIGRSGNSVAEVLNGLAIAPPAPSAKMGVLTSTKWSFRRKFRRYWVMYDLKRRTCAACGFTRKYACRLRTRVALSRSSSGSRCRLGERSFGSSVAETDSSPLEVRCGVPVTA